jgi:peptidoglycan/xylan/chitin deacetylase (PgdA/CDA1 family)
MYHRISDEFIEPNWLAVSPSQFTRQLEFIQQNYRPMHLTELVDALQQRSLPRRAIVITFDDGYCDNFQQALPLLETAKVPATVFVTSGHIGSRREFWWDELKRLVLFPTSVPGHLSLSICGQDYGWSTASLKDRQAAHEALQNLLRPLPPDEQDKVLDHLAGWAGLERNVLRPAYRTMTTAELTELAKSKFIEIGAHTVNHPILPAVSIETQRPEICESRSQLEMFLGQPVLTFAYPNGDFTTETAQVVKEAGFKAACTTMDGYVTAGDNLFQLRRCAVNNWVMATFKEKLAYFFSEHSRRD